MRPVLLALAAAALVVPGGVASAASGRAVGLHDARYCEIIELKGAPPTAVATVWNTLGLNRCPAAWWRAFDARALARELGDTLVVLNGPRHFLMDSVTAVTGRIRAFHGRRLRRVAAIPIRTAADLVQTPYTDRTIRRRNTWYWNRGRTVYELLAPGGDVYVMQAYAQIKDPTLTLAKLRSLGRRLKLPAGWRFRARRLARPLALTAKGTATIIQDDLQNTYQLATTTRPRTRPASHRVSIAGRTHTVKASTPGTVEDHGTVTGTPFGRGSIVLVGTLKGGRLTGSFRLVFPEGSVVGSVSMPFTIRGSEISFRGTGAFTGGTGRYRGISGTTQVRDHNRLDGQAGVLGVTGAATY